MKTPLCVALATALSLPLVASANTDGPTTPTAPIAAPAPIPQNATAFPVGKWPEGLVIANGSAWVAQSGERTVGRYHPATGALQATVKIGRLPVAMAVGPSGEIVVQVSTHKVLKRIDPQTGKVKGVAKLPDGPEETVVEGGFAYVLLWQDDSSAGSSVMRIDLKTGKSQRAKGTGANAFGLAVGGGLVWVARDGGITLLDAATLAPKGGLSVAGRPFHLAYAAGAAFATAGNTVARLSPEKETHRRDLGARVAAIAAWDDVVVAATADGMLWLLDPATLAVKARLQAPAAYTAQAIARDGQALLVTHHGSNGGAPGGTLLRVALP